MSVGRYQGRRAALASRNGKESAMALPLRFELGLELEVFRGGSVSKSRGDMSPRETALRRATEAAQATGLLLGWATAITEAPARPLELTTACAETMAFVDLERSVTVVLTLRPHRSNYSRCTARTIDDLADWLVHIDFPRQAVVVDADIPTSPSDSAIVTGNQLEAALARATRRSQGQAVVVHTDMRAHCNQSRMMGIQQLAFRTARAVGRLAGADGQS